MRTLSIMLVGVLGCAHVDVHDAIDGGQVALGWIRESVRPLEQVHHEATDLAIAYCRVKVTENSADARAQCLTQVGFSPAQIDEHEKALAAISEAYDAIAKSLDAIETAWPVLERMRQRAEALPK